MEVPAQVAQPICARQPRCEDPDANGKKCEESTSQSQSEDVPTEGGDKEPPSDKRERESPDTTTKPEGKSLKTSAAADVQENVAGGGTHTADSETDQRESSEKGKQSALLGLETHWKHMRTIEQAQEEAKKMRCSMPEWRLKTCMQLLCVKPPIVGAAGATNVYFANAEVTDAAVHCLVHLEGGGMESFKSSGTGTSSTTPAQGKIPRVRNQMQLELTLRLQQAEPTPRNLKTPR